MIYFKYAEGNNSFLCWCVLIPTYFLRRNRGTYESTHKISRTCAGCYDDMLVYGLYDLRSRCNSK